MTCPFLFLKVYFDEQKILIFMKFSLSCFSFQLVFLASCARNRCFPQNHVDFLLDFPLEEALWFRNLYLGLCSI